MPRAHVTAADAPITPAELMDWAEVTYWNLFPPQGRTSSTEPPFQYRYYAATGNYLGVAGEGDGAGIYVYGPVSGGSLTQVATLRDFACQVRPGTCRASPRLYPTSYLNAKAQGLAPMNLEGQLAWSAALARADFTGTGRFSLFATWGTYDTNKPIAEATPGVFGFWSIEDDGSMQPIPGLIDTPVGCLHPRKAAVADFNRDGRPDILVACHGYDAPPFPGEAMYLVSSTPSGVYASRPLSGFTGFFHGAAAADLDGDGWIDIVATDGQPAQLRQFRNRGDGSFEEVPDAFPPLPEGGYFTVEILDVDGDGHLDVLAGGHEYYGATTLFIRGDSTGNFRQAQKVVLPAMPDAGVALDFVKIGSTLWVGRTNAGPSGFYTRLGMQAVDLSTMTVTHESWKESLLFYWLLPGVGGTVLSDRLSRPL